MSTRIGIIGGTGLYSIDGLSDVEEIEIETPFGEPSSPIVSGRCGDAQLFFIARHGVGHVISPSEIPYRANIYALKQLGAQWCLSVSAVGSLAEERAPGDLVVPDQIIDRTKGRSSSFFERGLVGHVAFADPYCPVLRQALSEVASELVSASNKVHSDGTYLCMEGPQFSTRAESRMYRSWGANIIGMTGLPEAKLAREAELSYATLAMVTDYDCWRSESSDVDIEEILATMKENVSVARAIIPALAQKLASLEPSPMCSKALEFALVSDRSLIPDELKKKLKPIIGKYLEAEPT
jgi:5'-methylthioadenosine phosphorylase